MLVAGADPDHVSFPAADEALERVLAEGRLIAHTLAETYNALTSAAHARAPDAVLGYLGQFLEHEPAGLVPTRYPDALREIAAAGIVGPAIYDGLIALAARDAGLRLLSLDVRAERTYRLCGAEFELIAEPR